MTSSTPLRAEHAATELDRLGTKCLALVTEWVSQGQDSRTLAAPWPDASSFRSSMDVCVPEESVSENTLFAKIRAILHNSVNPWTHRFLEKLYSAPAVISIMGDLLLGVMNASVHVFSASPILTMIEEQCAAALCERVGYTAADADGLCMPGGAASNTFAVQTALSQLFGGVYRRGGVCALVDAYTQHKGRIGRGARPAILVSADAHFSLSRAALAAGLGTDAVVPIAVDKHGKMDTSELVRVCLEMEQEPAHTRGVPMMICATSGTTVLGAFDDLCTIAHICRRFACWMHVDASWGGAMVFLPSDAPARACRLDGLQEANSITINPHKLLGVTHQCSFLLVKNKLVLQVASLTEDAGYLFHDASTSTSVSSSSPSSSSSQPPRPLVNDMAAKTLGCGRRGDALKLYLVWLRYGTHGLSEHIQHGLHMAQLILARIEQTPTLELGPLAKPLFLQICFRPRFGGPDATRRMHAKLKASGQYVVDYAPVHEMGDFMRLVVHPTTPLDVYEALIDTLGGMVDSTL